jgi:hypothetical protein
MLIPKESTSLLEAYINAANIDGINSRVLSSREININYETALEIVVENAIIHVSSMYYAFRISDDELIVFTSFQEWNGIEENAILNSFVKDNDDVITIPKEKPLDKFIHIGITRNNLFDWSNESFLLNYKKYLFSQQSAGKISPPVDLHPCDYMDDHPGSPISLQMPFEEGSKWMVGGGLAMPVPQAARDRQAVQHPRKAHSSGNLFDDREERYSSTSGSGFIPNS